MSKLGLGIDFSNQAFSRWENGRRNPPANRDRHLELIRGLVELGGITSLAEVNSWLALGGQGHLTPTERRLIFGQAPPSETNLAGTMLGKYTLLDLLGQGGMAEVYRAYQLGLKREVAIKVLRPHLADRADFIQLFEQEALAVAKLRHSHIVQVIDFDVADGLYYLVMELIDGMTLATKLALATKQGTFFSLLNIAQLLTDLADAVDYAHQCGVIHLDIKPGNIMFTKTDQVRLTDFGIARLLDPLNLTESDHILGTPAYMAPEQALGEEVDGRCDIYALTVVLYEILTGQLPFVDKNQAAALGKLVAEAPPSPRTLRPDLSLEIEQIVLQGLAKDPQARYQTATDLATDFSRAVGLDQHQTSATSKEADTDKSTVRLGLDAPFQAPPRRPHFVNRTEEIAHLRNRLQTAPTNLILGLYGTGGIGKTALTIQLTHRLRDHFRDGVLWANLQNTTPEAVLHSFAAPFGQAETVAQALDLNAKSTLVRQILVDKHILIILDNAQSNEMVEPLLTGGQQNVTIMTSRNRRLLTNVGAEPYQIVPFAAEAGLALLKNILGKARVEAELMAAQQILHLVGGLPLAVNIIAGHLSEVEDETLADYLLTLQDEQDRLKALVDWVDPSQDVEATFQLSYERLPSTLQQRFAMLSIFEGPDFGLQAVATIAKITLTQARADLGRLCTLSLVETGFVERETLTLAEQVTRGRYHLHPLLKLFAAKKLEADAKTIHRRVAQYFADLSWENRWDGYALLDLEWENMLGALRWAYDNKVWSILIQGARGLSQINLGVAGFIDARGHWQEGIQLLGWAIEAPEVSQDLMLQATLLTCLGTLTLRVNDLEVARTQLMKSLNLLDQCPPSSERTLQRVQLYGLLARLVINTDRAEAQQWLRQGLSELTGLDTEAARHHEGYLYVQLTRALGQMGQFEKAIQAAEQGLALLPTRASAARIGGFLNLGTIFGLLGNPEQAIAYLKAGIKDALRLGDWRQLAIMRMNLGMEEAQRGNLIIARAAEEEALALFRQMGDLHHQTAALNNMGFLLIKSGHLEEAEDFVLQAIQYAKQHNLRDFEADAKANLTAWQIQKHLLAEATVTWQQAYNICLDEELTYLLPELWRLKAQIGLGEGDLAVALTSIDTSTGFAQDEQNPIEEAISLRVKGQILSQTQHVSEAETAFEQSLTALQNRNPFEAAKTRLALAQLYHTYSPSQATASTSELQTACSIFEKQQAGHLLNEAKALLREFQEK